MSVTPDALKRALADGAAAAAKVARSDEAIAKAAAERRDVISKRIDELRGKSMVGDDDAKEYQALIEERGQLDIVIGGGHAVR